MSFEFKGINGLSKVVLLGIVGLALVFIFLNFLPFILLIALVCWSINKIVKSIKVFKGKSSTITNVDYNTPDSKESYSNGQIIDVDYEEVK